MNLISCEGGQTEQVGGKKVSRREDHLIEGEKLAELLKLPPPNLKLVDASFTPSEPAKAKADHIAKRITTDTVFFDLFEIKDEKSKLLFMTPNEEDFTKHMARLGIKKD